TSAILDATEQSFRGAGLTLPLQTGRAITGARGLPPAPKAAGDESAGIVAVASAPGDELAGRASAHGAVHVNIAVHVAPAVVRDSSEAPGGREIVGGDIMSTASWAPTENVSGVHLTDAAAV